MVALLVAHFTVAKGWSNVLDMSAEWVTAVGTVISAIAASGAVAVAFIIWQQQKALTEDLSKRHDELAKELADKSRLLTQRQLLLPLWQYMSTLNRINSEAPAVPDVLKAVNTLELIAICCEGEIIDPKVVKRTFRETFIEIYGQIKRCNKLEGIGKNGDEILLENKAALAFYDELMGEHKQRDSLGAK